MEVCIHGGATGRTHRKLAVSLGASYSGTNALMYYVDLLYIRSVSAALDGALCAAVLSAHRSSPTCLATSCRRKQRRSHLTQPPWQLDASTKWRSWVSFRLPDLHCNLQPRDLLYMHVCCQRDPVMASSTKSSIPLFETSARLLHLPAHPAAGCLFTGAAGGIGQPLALLLKGSPSIGELSLYDIVGTEGVGTDLSHIDSSAKVGAHALNLRMLSPLHCATFVGSCALSNNMADAGAWAAMHALDADASSCCVPPCGLDPGIGRGFCTALPLLDC